MPDETLMAVRQSSVGSLFDYFGFTKSKAIPMDILRSIMEIGSILKSRNVDEETSVGILKSFEERLGKADDGHLRVDRFLKFVRGLDEASPERNVFLDTVKNMGLFSKPELEQYAKDTGDWSHFIKRATHDTKVDAPRPEANV